MPDFNEPDVPVVEAVPPAGGRRWLLWMLGIFGGGGLLVCGGCAGLILWFASSKPIDISYPSAQRQGAAIAIRLEYTLKGRTGIVPFTKVIIEGPNWKHQQPAFGGFTIPVSGQITAIVPPVGNQPREGGSATIYLESESKHGGGMERSSNKVSVTIPAP